jgi:hypothetical protein
MDTPRDENGQRNFAVFLRCLIRFIATRDASLSEKVKVYLDGLWNIAPEILGQANHWADVARILARNTPTEMKDMEDWQKQVMDLFNDKIKFETILS